MAIHVALNHKTTYTFDRLVALSPHTIRLWPAPHCRTPILCRSMRITPKHHFLNWQQDPYGNYLARLVFPEKSKELSIEVDIVANMTVINPFDFFVEPYATDFPFKYDALLAKELVPFLEVPPAGPKMAEWMETVPRGKKTINDFMVEINQRVHHAIRYIIRMEPGVQTAEETLTLRSGSCRDSGWLLVQTLRHLGLAARFVSGYLIQLVADVKALDGPSGAAKDFCDLHAWAEVYIPGAGWIGLDPTSGLLAGEGHIPLACTAEPASAGPVSGAVDDCETTFGFEMSVTRIHEDPRVTKPYSEIQWQQIQALGQKVEAQLKHDDVRLTMGGEPTFVAIDHPDDAEWNTTAQGPNKRRLAGDLIKRLRDRFAPSGLLHYGQGKLYPGESLPRWALGCYWRKDGQPLWRNPALVADDGVKNNFTDTHAKKLVAALCARLGIETKLIIPGFEDAMAYMLQERQLPINVDVLDNKLEHAETRRRLSSVFDQGLNAVIGYALPLQRRVMDGLSGSYKGLRWVSGPWFLRREHMFLVQGDSPMGWRMPLSSLPWASKEYDGSYYELDPFAARRPLPAINELQQSVVPVSAEKSAGDPADQYNLASRNEFRAHGRPSLYPPEPGIDIKALRDLSGAGAGVESGAQKAAPGSQEKVRANEAYDVIRTALCVQVRQGHLYVFMPPQRYLEDYIHLITAIEDTASELSMPVFIEGYTPPHDDRLNVLKVTPDPGVIEVNVHPARNWDELARNTEIIYEEARLSRLATEKFMLDGRHTGTGGGNHIVIGGITPQDSPMLRRPDVLSSLIRYWHNHPSLSFLFSGLFVGPTSQHPRVDEARNDSVYEIGLALKQLPTHGETPPPWLVDRALRHLLTDSSGNTHRTEFSIDKLYSPDSSSGRLGLVELRSFEMPPHFQMSLAQQLLLRTFIANFWRAPYTKKLVRWGTELHDRFMLPHFVAQDFDDVIDDLKEAGYPMQKAWFAPHVEFRFPRLGSFTQRGVQVELRQAIEPWHVLGEETTASGAVRYVDTSLERLQVQVSGMTNTRHMATCNGRRLPLRPTGANGEFVAGVRYRAWQPPSCLHPTIPVNVPLVVELFDTWNGRSLGGCTYHVAHPGGRAHERFPINAYEAESRRVARFTVHGHTPGPMTVPAEEVSAEFPFTLDLRFSPQK